MSENTTTTTNVLTDYEKSQIAVAELQKALQEQSAQFEEFKKMTVNYDATVKKLESGWAEKYQQELKTAPAYVQENLKALEGSPFDMYQTLQAKTAEYNKIASIERERTVAAVQSQIKNSSGIVLDNLMDRKGIIAGGYVPAIIDPGSAPAIENFTPTQPGQKVQAAKLPQPRAITTDANWFDK